MPEIKRILAMHLLERLISEAPPDEDAERNTDLMVLALNTDVRIGCRVRRYKYFEKYSGQFTIRNTRPSGVKSELTKILENWGRYLFYGISNEAETGFVTWVIGDLSVFRLWFNQQLFLSPARVMPGEPVINPDGSSTGLAFNIKDLPAEFVIARKEPLPIDDVDPDDLPF